MDYIVYHVVTRCVRNLTAKSTESHSAPSTFWDECTHIHPEGSAEHCQRIHHLKPWQDDNREHHVGNSVIARP